MSGKISKSGFAKNIRPDGVKEAEHRKTAKEDPVPPVESAEPEEQSARRRGRPKSEKKTDQLLIRPKVDNIRRLRVYAAERGIGTSVVVDALIEQYLDELNL